MLSTSLKVAQEYLRKETLGHPHFTTRGPQKLVQDAHSKRYTLYENSNSSSSLCAH